MLAFEVLILQRLGQRHEMVARSARPTIERQRRPTFRANRFCNGRTDLKGQTTSVSKAIVSEMRYVGSGDSHAFALPHKRAVRAACLPGPSPEVALIADQRVPGVIGVEAETVKLPSVRAVLSLFHLPLVASLCPASRLATHDSGSVWLARPSPYGSSIPSSTPVYPGVLIRTAAPP